jgi:hypothetical protein
MADKVTMEVYLALNGDGDFEAGVPLMNPTG